MNADDDHQQNEDDDDHHLHDDDDQNSDIDDDVQVGPKMSKRAQPFQSIFLITDIATYRLNQPRGQCSENHLKCITMWKCRDGVTITIFLQHTRDGHETGYLYEDNPIKI